VKIDTTLRQWCSDCGAATISRRCHFAPDICCAGCCAPGNRPCEADDDTYLWPDPDDDDELAARRARKSG
jgi:hypothetical protein